MKENHDSVTAMVAEADKQGWLREGELKQIPELFPMYNDAADYFLNIIDKNEPKLRETFMYHSCRYLFAKAIEGVILWGISPKGKISVFFHPRHLVGEFETEVPRHLHQVVVDSMIIGESLYKAHREWAISTHKKGIEFDLHEEMKQTLRWIPRLGIHYGLTKQYDALR